MKKLMATRVKCSGDDSIICDPDDTDGYTEISPGMKIDPFFY